MKNYYLLKHALTIATVNRNNGYTIDQTKHDVEVCIQV
jgi:hypothetical protein